MRFLIAALVLTLAVAIAAATFAIWPVVADAPWEVEDAASGGDVPVSMNEIRCEAALRLRESAMAGLTQYADENERAPWGATIRKSFRYRGLEAQLAKAQREIDRYC